MNNASRDILRLKRCPQCDYQLLALPAPHRCPECGFAYDESMFDLPVWWRGAEYFAWEWPAYLGVLVVATLGFLWQRWSVPVSVLVMITGGVVIEITKAIVKLRLRSAEGNIRFLFDADGVSFPEPGARLTVTGAGRATRPAIRRSRDRHDWASFRRSSVRRARRGRWRMRLAWRWPRGLVRRDIDVTVRGTRREAALLRNELRRRVRAARVRRR